MPSRGRPPMPSSTWLVGGCIGGGCSFPEARQCVMTKLYIAIDEALAVVRQHNGTWTTDLRLLGNHPQCVAVDPLRTQRVYCGTFDQGVWRSDGAGKPWEPAGEGMTQRQELGRAV